MTSPLPLHDTLQKDTLLSATNAKQKRPELFAMAGDEMQCLTYLRAGYDGLLLGGAIFNAPLVIRLMEIFRSNPDEAEALDTRIRARNEMIYGAGCRYWMGGIKYFMFRRGLSGTTNHHLKFELPSSLKKAIDAFVQNPSGS